MMTKVIPAAMIAMNDAASATLRRLSGEPKVGTRTKPATMTMASATTAPLRSSAEATLRLRTATAGASAAGPVAVVGVVVIGRSSRASG